MQTLSFSQIEQAYSLLSSHIKKTRLSLSRSLSEDIGTNLFFKWENEHRIKSFKIRGALNKILSLTKEERAKGLIAASAGNHAQGVALASQITKTKSRVVMMEQASQVKILSSKALGVEVILYGKTYDESYQYARSIQGDAHFIHPFADSFVQAGQGTIGLEIYQDLPEVDSIILPIGGGGLASGVGLAIKTIKPSCKIYGVVWQGTPDYCKRFYNEKEKTCSCSSESRKMQSGIVDGIAVKPYKGMFEIFSKHLEAMTCVSEDEISQAVVKVLATEGQIVEGSGAAALAGLLKNKNKWDLGKNCLVILTGGNIDSSVLDQIVEKQRQM